MTQTCHHRPNSATAPRFAVLSCISARSTTASARRDAARPRCWKESTAARCVGQFHARTHGAPHAGAPGTGSEAGGEASCRNVRVPRPPARARDHELDIGLRTQALRSTDGPASLPLTELSPRKTRRSMTDSGSDYGPMRSCRVSRHLSQALNRGHSARILSMPASSAIRGP